MAGCFTVEKIKSSLQEEGVYLKIAHVWDIYSNMLDVPFSQRNTIRHSLKLNDAGKLDKVLAYVVKTHPYGSWRLLIWALDEMGHREDADVLRAYAEPVDQSLTCEAVLSILKCSSLSIRDWLKSDHLADTLLVPGPRKEAICQKFSSATDQGAAVIEYWCQTLYNASWGTLAGALFYLGEKEMIDKVKHNVRSTPHYSKPILCGDLQEAARSISKYSDDLRRMLNIPHKTGTVDMRYVADKEMEAKKKHVFETFITRHPSPSWRQFAHTLYRLGEHEALVELFNKHLPYPEKLRCYDAYQRALEAHGYHDQIVMQGVMTGFPRAGKSSLMARLNCQEVTTTPHSTGVAEHVVRIDLSESVGTAASAEDSVVKQAPLTRMQTTRVTVNSKQRKWRVMSNCGEEFATVVSQISTGLHGDSKSADRDTFSLPLPSPVATDANDFPPTSFPPAAKSKTHKRSGSMSNFLEGIRKQFHRKKLKRVSSVDTVVSSPQSLFGSSLDKEALSEELLSASLDEEVLWTLYLSDVGGQPEFQELLAAVVSGPTVFFVVFPLHLSMDKTFNIEYLDEGGDSMVAYESSLTMREAILQTVASISSTGVVTNEGSRVLPKVLFVGTHKDKLDICTQQEEIRKIDQDLQLMVERTDAIEENMVVFASESRMIFTVDNMQSGKHEDFRLIRSAIEEIGEEKGSAYKISVPYTWMTLSVRLRQKLEEGVQVYSYEECFRDAQKLGIKDKADFNDALYFLHNNLGILRYYHDIPVLRDRIITDTQHIFNNVTAVIRNTFTFKNFRSKKGAFDEFQKKGIFSRDDLMRLLSTKSQDMSPEQLLALLEHLNIIAPFDQKGKSCKYFLPCALQHVQKHSGTEKTRCYDSLLFTFARGYCPKGIFGALVVEILKRTPEPEGYKWDLDKGTIFRNQFAMTVGPYSDKFHFTLLPDYIKIDVYPSKVEKRSKNSLSSICTHVQKVVKKCLSKVTKKLNYNDGAKHTLTFLCPAGDHPHPVETSFLNEIPTGLRCTDHEEVRQREVDEKHFIWFPSDPGSVLPPLSELLRHLYPVANSWLSLAVQLDIRRFAYMNIEYKYQKDPNSPRPQLEEIVSRWYERATSLKQLIEALRALDEECLADTLEKKYILG